MDDIIQKQLWADVIIYCFPLYYYNVPGILKNMIDRQLPMVLPFMEERKDGYGSGSHAKRYDMSHKRYVLISTCGFYSSKGNYDSVQLMFDHICGQNNYETIFCGQGELFSIPELHERTEKYLSVVCQAGSEFSRGGISQETKQILANLLLPKETFEQMADSNWGIDPETGQKQEKSLTFTRQMAALYDKTAYDGIDRVIEICYTDLDQIYQLHLKADGCEVLPDCPLISTTRIDTPFNIWQDIAKGKIRGDIALKDQLYHVSGDMSIMIQWPKFFHA